MIEFLVCDIIYSLLNGKCDSSIFLIGPMGIIEKNR